MTPQEMIARLYLERNRRYESLPACRVILNLGCGSGSFPQNYPHHDCLIVNVDRDESLAGYPAYGPTRKGFSGFAEIAEHRSLNVKHEVMDLYRLPSHVFDMVVCGQLVEHFGDRDLELILHEIHRLLIRHGGLLQIDTVTSRLDAAHIGEHKQSFTLKSLGDLLERMLFERIELAEFAEGAGIWALYGARP